jgi:hypothetical protein
MSGKKETREDAEMVESAYKKGYIDSLIAFAYWKNGKQYVGTCGTLLEEQIKTIEDVYNYMPPLEGGD